MSLNTTASFGLDTLYAHVQSAMAALERITQSPPKTYHYSEAQEAVEAAHQSWRRLCEGEWQGIHRKTLSYPGLVNACSAEQFLPLVQRFDIRSAHAFEARLREDLQRLKTSMKKVPGAPVSGLYLPNFDAHLPALSALSDAISRYKETLPPAPADTSPAQTSWSTWVREGLSGLGGRIKR